MPLSLTSKNKKRITFLKTENYIYKKGNMMKKLKYKTKATTYAVRAALLLGCSLSAPLYAEEESVEKETKENVIVITGIRDSLKSNLKNKRNANNIVDSIDSSDVSKNPDKNVAEALQRIAGVQLIREFGEGLAVSIRGTSPDLTNTLVNGQTLASAEWRPLVDENNSTDFSGVSAEQIAKIEVYKSPQADLVSGGIGGTIILTTRTPLGLDSESGYVSFDAQYNQGSGKKSPQLAGQYNWKNADETFGALANISYSELNVQRDGTELILDWRNYYSPGTAAGGRVLNPFWANQARFTQDRKRTNVNVSVEYQPTEAFNIVGNFIGSYADMGNKSEALLLSPLRGFRTIRFDTDLWTADQVEVFDDAGNSLGFRNSILTDATFNALALRNNRFQNIWQQTIDRDGTKVNSSTFNIQSTYEDNNILVVADFGRSNTKSHKANFMNGFALNNIDSPEVNALLDAQNVNYTNNGVFSFSNDTGLFTNPTQEFAQNEFWRDYTNIDNSNDFAKVDFTYEFSDNSLITSIKTGLHYSKQSRTKNKSMDRSSATWYNFVFDDDFRQGATVDQYINGTLTSLNTESGALPSEYFTLDMNLARDNFENLAILGNLADCPINDICRTGYQQRGTSYDVETDKISFYVMANFAGEKYRGNIGGRFVDSSTDRNNILQDGTVPVSQSGGYSDFMPSFNLSYDLSESVVGRLAIARTISQPTFSDTIGEFRITSTGVANRGRMGNPNLKPFTSDQYELGAEWYFDDASLFAVTYFNKQIKNWIVDTTLPLLYEDLLYLVDLPTNTEGTQDLSGVETQLQHDFNNGFGFLVNYTYSDVPSVDVKYFEYDIADDELVTDDIVPLVKEASITMSGNSRHTANAQFYFEDEQYSARLSYNYRSDFVVDENLRRGMKQMKEGAGRFDLKATYNYSDDLLFSVSVINLTNELSKRYLIADAENFEPQYVGRYQHRTYENGRRFFLGVNYQF